jgi:hypothetical protein
MLYDIRTSPEQLKKLGEWVDDGVNMADVELVVDDRMLLAEQGDSRMAWDLGGEPASREYLTHAPLDPPHERIHHTPTKAIVERVREALRELHARTPDAERHTLDLVCDRWDEYEQEIADEPPIPFGSRERALDECQDECQDEPDPSDWR